MSDADYVWVNRPGGMRVRVRVDREKLQQIERERKAQEEAARREQARLRREAESAEKKAERERKKLEEVQRLAEQFEAKAESHARKVARRQLMTRKAMGVVSKPKVPKAVGHCARTQRWRDRKGRGVVRVVQVEVTLDTIEALVGIGFLKKQSERYSHEEVQAAVQSLLTPPGKRVFSDIT